MHMRAAGLKPARSLRPWKRSHRAGFKPAARFGFGYLALSHYSPPLLVLYEIVEDPLQMELEVINLRRGEAQQS